MERPSDWSPVGRGSDPTPGDPVVVREGGQGYQAVAAKLTRAAATLRAMAAGSTSGSASVAALLENRDELTTQVETAAARYRAAGDALVEYSYALDRVQATTSQALARARSAQCDLNENTRLAKLYSRLADQADTPEQAEQRVRYLRLETSRWEDVGEANTRITSERQVIDQAVVERDLAAQTASDRIEQVTSSDGLNDSWWADWGAKVVAWITDVAGVIASIAGILALLVCWIPVIGQALAGVLMIIAAVAAVINALGNIALAATGERSWTEAVISIVGAVLACVGLGALKGSFSALKGAMGLWRSGGGVGAFGGLGGLSRAAWVGFTGAVKSAATNAAMRLLPTLRAMTGKTVLGRGIDDFVKFRSLMFNQRELRPIAGYHDVFVHGTPTSVIGDFEEELTAKQLAEIIRGGNWDGLESIRLVACQTGRGPFAQQLADELGVPVLAPLNDVWSSGRGKNLMEDWNRLAQLVERLPR